MLMAGLSGRSIVESAGAVLRNHRAIAEGLTKHPVPPAGMWHDGGAGMRPFGSEANMAIVAGIVLALAFIWTLRVARQTDRSATMRRPRAPEPARLELLFDADLPRRDPLSGYGEQGLGDVMSQTPGEADEAALIRDLISGAIDPATYRTRMSDLAHFGRWGGKRHEPS
jgi:hypothetical protein